MTIRTYTVYGIGSVGPAHPSYNPSVRVTLTDDGAPVGSSTQPTGRDGHRWALEQGYVLHESQAETADRLWYQDLVNEVGPAANASRRAVPAPADLTYTVYGKGSVGPAHPNYDPRVTVSVLKDGETIERITQPSYREGHRWAVGKGYALHESQASTASCDWYQDMLGQARLTA